MAIHLWICTFIETSIAPVCRGTRSALVHFDIENVRRTLRCGSFGNVIAALNPLEAHRIIILAFKFPNLGRADQEDEHEGIWSLSGVIWKKMYCKWQHRKNLVCRVSYERKCNLMIARYRHNSRNTMKFDWLLNAEVSII